MVEGGEDVFDIQPLTLICLIALATATLCSSGFKDMAFRGASLKKNHTITAIRQVGPDSKINNNLRGEISVEIWLNP